MTIRHGSHANAAGAPVVETGRLILRGHDRADLDDYAALWSDPAVVRYVGGRPFTREECWSRLLRAVGHWQVMGYGFWLAFDKATERLAGEIGLGEFKREMVPPLPEGPEAGWVLAPWAHGQGLGTEAVSAALAWIDRELAPARTVCIIHPDNAASVRVAEKCGFRPGPRATYRELPTLTFERPRP
jgi:RimJ/RimL family protein N-acetyltransferase